MDSEEYLQLRVIQLADAVRLVLQPRPFVQVEKEN